MRDSKNSLTAYVTTSWYFNYIKKFPQLLTSFCGNNKRGGLNGPHSRRSDRAAEAGGLGRTPGEARGMKLKRYGKDLIGLCPFHDDHEP